MILNSILFDMNNFISWIVSPIIFTLVGLLWGFKLGEKGQQKKDFIQLLWDWYYEFDKEITRNNNDDKTNYLMNMDRIEDRARNSVFYKRKIDKNDSLSNEINVLWHSKPIIIIENTDRKTDIPIKDRPKEQIYFSVNLKQDLENFIKKL